MAEDKKSIVIYSDWESIFEQLDDLEAGQLIKHFFKYVNDKNPQLDDRLLKMAFEPMKLQLKRDLTKWNQTKARRSEAGKKGGLKSGEVRKIEPNEANASKSKQIEANEAVTVNDNVTVNVTDNVTVIKKESSSRFTPPSLLDVQNYIIEKKYGVNAHSFWNFYESKNWMVGKNKMKDYKKAIAGWEAREKDNSNKNQNGKQQFANPVKTAYEFSVDRVIETHAGNSE